MKITIIKAFKGHTSSNQQSSIWIRLDDLTKLDLIVNLYKSIQSEYKIIVSDKYSVLDDNTISLSYVNLDCAVITLNSIERIINGENEILVRDQLKFRLSGYGEVGQNNAYFINDALELDIPYFKFSYNGYYFGTGIYKQAFSSTSTKNTSAIGLNLAKNKVQSANLLKQAGFPSPTHLQVSTLEEATIATNNLGFPVVVKPVDRDNGDGVFANITSVEDLKSFFLESKEFSNNILIEKHQSGFGHRITVYENEVVSISKKLPFGVTGDGISTISQLLNSKMDPEIVSMVNSQNLRFDSIIEYGKFIPLRRKNNASAGGSTFGLSKDDVHPDNLKLAFEVAKLFNLDICGIDLIIDDIKNSWLETECIICDVNAVPQIGFDRVKNIFNPLFKNVSRIPIYLAIVKSLDNLNLDKLKRLTSANAHSTAQGVWVDDMLVSNRYENGFDSARSLIFNSNVKRGLVVMTEIGVKNFGLPLDKFDSVILCETELNEELNWILKGQNIININE